MDRKPWEGYIPESDIRSFKKDADFIDRGISAGTRPALVIVDMTRAFVDGRYPTGWSETGYPAAAANAKLLAAARDCGIPVYFTKAYPYADYLPAPAQRGRWKMGGRSAPDPSLPPGDVIVDEITPIAGEVVIDKGSKPSGFFGTQLASLLIYEGVDTCIVTGMTTSGCVRATVLDAFQYNFNVIIPHEACADRSQLSHAVSLCDMHMKYADVVSVEETIGYVRAVAPRVAATV